LFFIGIINFYILFLTTFHSNPFRPHQNKASVFEENLAVAVKAQFVTLTSRMNALGTPKMAKTTHLVAKKSKKKR